MHTATWHVELFLSEEGDQTFARAVLHGSSDSVHPTGIGVAHRAPRDRDVPEIGEEVAAARALHGLAHELLTAAGDDIAEIEHHDVRLRMPQP